MTTEEAKKRLFENVFVCRRCKHKMRAKGALIRAKQIVCRNPKCGSRSFRPKKKERKTVEQEDY